MLWWFSNYTFCVNFDADYEYTVETSLRKADVSLESGYCSSKYGFGNSSEKHIYNAVIFKIYFLCQFSR